MFRAVLARLRRRIPRSLGAKLVAILTGIALLGAGAVTLLLALVITPSFDRLEQQAVDGHVERTRAALTEYASKVEASVRDYGDWNESYEYMRAPNRAFEEDSFATSAMVNLGVNGMAYVRTNGEVVIARWLDIETGEDQPEMRARMLTAIRGIDFNRALAKGNSDSFYVRLGDRIAAVGIAQVRRTDGTGDPRGYVVMARLVTSAQLSTLLQLDARLDVPHPVATPAVVPGARGIAVAVPVPGEGGVPVASATYSVPRELSALGRDMLRLAVIGTTALLLLVMAVLSLMIVRLVLRPLNRVERHMGMVRTSGNPIPLTEEPRRDEIGSLVTSFNAMLSQLKDLREQVEAQSFKLGQSESAVAVMHNVRNALNPISTVLSQGLAQVSTADRALLDRAMAELADENIPAARRQKLAAFVAAAFESELRAREERKAQLAIGRDALHNVLEIIGRQQEQAHERPPLDTCDVTDIVARNATIARYSGVSSIAFQFPSQPHWVMANRVLLSQVVGNLFSNAAEAIAATGRDGGSIAVTIHDLDDGQVEVMIRDDGEGFDPDAGPQLFQRGFSTRKNKSGGLGLHWCANSMVAMGGALALRSEGRGQGACAVLTLAASDAMRTEAAA
ncbi:MAG: histidine kinase [Alphaproteobacteria bacterium HGW-Alphaproteobacteria-15]|nr:MAG: histidine kinase [Alphaproteobacteria bacterium HGW-Alphaproteobacteria-15]